MNPHRNMPSSILSALIALAPLVAAAPVTPFAPLSSAATSGDKVGPRLDPWTEASGVGWTDDGRLMAAGPGYKADLSATGVAFTPALGELAAENGVLTLSARAVTRGGERWELARTPFAAAGAQRAVRTLGAGVVERADARADGLELSFELTHLPGTSGELALELAVDGNLPWPAAGALASGLRFVDPDSGGVAIGGVTGIDADGARAAGRLVWSNGTLALVLPASFADAARLPLVIDPLVGPEIVITNPESNDGDPDVGYEPTADTYLVAWERRFSATDVDVIGARLTGGGVLIDGIVPIETSDTLVGLNPSVCSVNPTNQFAVAYQRAASFVGPFDIAVSSVDAAVGAIDGALSFSPFGSGRDPDVGGEFNATLVGPDPDRVIVVYEQVDAGIDFLHLGIPASGNPTFLSTASLSGSANDSKPVISKSCGASGRYLVAWQRFFPSPAPGDHDLHRAVVDRNGAILVPSGTFLASIGPDETNIALDGDGAKFLAVWEVDPTQDGIGSHDLQDALVTVSATTVVKGTTFALQTSAGSDDRDPAVALCGPKFIVAWADQDSFLDYRIRLTALDPATCFPCETGYDAVALETDTDSVGSIELASKFSAGATSSTSDQALLAWDSLLAVPPFLGGIHVQRVEALGPGGPVVNLGGGCNSPGNLKFAGPLAVGNSAFAVHLTDAPPSAFVAVLTIAPPGASTLSCGTCTILPFAPLIFVKGVTAGQATQPLAVPCDVGLDGVQFDLQWAAIPDDQVGCSLFPQFSFTDIVRAEVGF